MNLKAELLRGVLAEGFETPAGIQQQAVLPGIRGHDIIIQAQSGMGKTAAMLMIILERIDIKNPTPQALILAPTRELAIQIHQVIRRMCKYMVGISSRACYGGNGFRWEDERDLIHEGCHIVVGTIGRLNALMTKDETGGYRTEIVIHGSNLSMFVIDEADKMLTDHQFGNDLEKMFYNVSGDAQVILMSATMPETALKNANYVCKSPKHFLINNYELTLEGIRQFHVNVGEIPKEKLHVLEEILPLLKNKRSFVFCNTRARVNKLYSKLGDSEDISISQLEGLKYQRVRERILNDFRRGEIRTLISSDLTGRGIDVQQVSVVINFDLPEFEQDYIHRVGRAGRFGRAGIAISLITANQTTDLEKIEKYYNTRIPPMPTNLAEFLQSI